MVELTPFSELHLDDEGKQLIANIIRHETPPGGDFKVQRIACLIALQLPVDERCEFLDLCGYPAPSPERMAEILEGLR